MNRFHRAVARHHDPHPCRDHMSPARTIRFVQGNPQRSIGHALIQPMNVLNL